MGLRSFTCLFFFMIVEDALYKNLHTYHIFSCMVLPWTSTVFQLSIQKIPIQGFSYSCLIRVVCTMWRQQARVFKAILVLTFLLFNSGFIFLWKKGVILSLWIPSPSPLKLWVIWYTVLTTEYCDYVICNLDQIEVEW